MPLIQQKIYISGIFDNIYRENYHWFVENRDPVALLTVFTAKTTTDSQKIVIQWHY